MATTTTDLFRSVMDKTFKVKPLVYPGDGVLYPRWEAKEYTTSTGESRKSEADVDLVMGT